MRHSPALLRRFLSIVVVSLAVVAPLGATTVGSGPRGLLVDKVDVDGPAEKAGIVVNDIITAVDGVPLESPKDIIMALAHHKPGDTMCLTIREPAKADASDVTLVLGASPDDPGRPYMGLSVLTIVLLVPAQPSQPPQPVPPST